MFSGLQEFVLVRFDIQTICDLNDQRAGHTWKSESQPSVSTEIPSEGTRTNGHDQGNRRASVKAAKGGDGRIYVDSRQSS